MDRSSLTPPAERVCERCGRREVWDADAGSWRVAADGDDRAVGDPFCIHEWDLTGSYNAFAESD